MGLAGLLCSKLETEEKVAFGVSSFDGTEESIPPTEESCERRRREADGTNGREESCGVLKVARRA